MRPPKGGLLAVAALAALVCAGTGFAAFTSSAFINASGTAGTLGPLVWGPSPAYGGFAPNDICLATVGGPSGDTLYLTAGNLAPGDICSYGDTLTNLGSLPAATSEQVTSASGALCPVLVFGDNFFSPSILIGGGGQTSTVSHTIGPGAGGAIQWAGFISLLPSAGNAYAGLSCSFVVTVTGSAGT